MNSSKILSLMMAGSIVTGACGESKSTMNPVAPSAVVIGTHNDEASDAGAESSAAGGKPSNPGNGGNGNGNDDRKGRDKDKEKGKDQPTVPTTPTPSGNVTPPTNTSPPGPSTRKVEIEGLITGTAGDSIVVNGQTVVVPATCPIRHGSTTFSLADLRVGDRVHVRALRTTSGVGVTANTTLEATDVKLQNPGGGTDDGEPVDPTALVSVTAFDAFASEAAGGTGAFRLTRSGSAALLASPLTVTFALSGTAVNGSDYQNTPVTATFLATQASVDVIVTPLADTTTERAESVILTLLGVAPYDVGSPASATVTITDTEAPVVSVTAFDSTASETGPDLGTFRFSRTGSTALVLTVTFTVTGTAISGTDYQSLPLTVTFNAGQATADLVVVPSPDATLEGSETAIVTVTDVEAYDLGSPASATITITG